MYLSRNRNGGAYRADSWPSIIERQSFFGKISKKNPLDPKIGGILRGAPLPLHKPDATIIDSTPHIS